MGYYHTTEFQRVAARETRRQGFERWHQDVLDSIQSRRANRQNPGSSARFDAVSRAYENAWLKRRNCNQSEDLVAVLCPMSDCLQTIRVYYTTLEI